MIVLKLYAIMMSSLLLICLMVTGLGKYLYHLLSMRLNNHNSCSAMMISNTVKTIDDEMEIKTDMSTIKKSLKILSVLLMIFTIIYFTCFGCVFFLADSTSLTAQKVTLSSEAGANETYPDSMGEYQLAEKETMVNNWYRHVDRDDRFLVYNNLGNIEY